MSDRAELPEDDQPPVVAAPPPGNPLGRWIAGSPVVTGLILLNVVVYVAELLTGGITGQLDGRLFLDTSMVASQPWALVTTLFVHGSVVSLLVSAFSLYSAGPFVERVMGHSRFLVVYLVGGIVGSIVTVVTSTGPVAGAAPATLAMLGAIVVIYVRLRAPLGRILQLLVVNVVINVVIVSISGGVGWVGAVGGLLAGALLAGIYSIRTRRP